MVEKKGYIRMSSRGLLRPLRGSGFALGQPDRLRRQAHLERRLADVAARERGRERDGEERGRDRLRLQLELQRRDAREPQRGQWQGLAAKPNGASQCGAILVILGRSLCSLI